MRYVTKKHLFELTSRLNRILNRPATPTTRIHGQRFDQHGCFHLTGPAGQYVLEETAGEGVTNFPLGKTEFTALEMKLLLTGMVAGAEADVYTDTATARLARNALGCHPTVAFSLPAHEASLLLGMASLPRERRRSPGGE